MIHQVLIYKSLYWIFKIVFLTIYQSQVLRMMMDFDISEFLNYYESNEPNLSNYFQQYLLNDLFYHILTS
jgi:hypothetical protein